MCSPFSLLTDYPTDPFTNSPNDALEQLEVLYRIWGIKIARCFVR